MGGRIEVSSEFGKGTTFKMWVMVGKVLLQRKKQAIMQDLLDQKNSSKTSQAERNWKKKNDAKMPISFFQVINDNRGFTRKRSTIQLVQSSN